MNFDRFNDGHSEVTQPVLNWAPSPPSKKIKKLASRQKKSSLVVQTYSPIQVVHQDQENQNINNAIIHNEFSEEDDLLDEFVFNSELFVEDKTSLFDNDLFDDGDQLYFTCSTQIESKSLFEEMISNFSALQLFIEGFVITETDILLLINSIKGIESSVVNINFNCSALIVSLSFSLFERCLPNCDPENKYRLLNYCFPLNSSFNIVVISSHFFPKFGHIPSLVYLSHDENQRLFIKTGMVTDDVHLMPIFFPHIFITGSNLADSFFCERKTSIQQSYPLCEPEGSNLESAQRMHLGNLVHFLLESCLLSSDFSREFITFSLERFISMSLEFENQLEKIIRDEDAQVYITELLQHWASLYYSHATVNYSDKYNGLQISKVIITELPIFSIPLGIHGKLDALVYSSTGKLSVLEIKSGKSTSFGNTSHRAQTLIYHTLFYWFAISVGIEKKLGAPLITYLNLDLEGRSNFVAMEEINFSYHELISLLFRRNELAFIISKGGHFSFLPFPTLKTINSWKCRNCPVKRTCQQLSDMRNGLIDNKLISFYESWHQLLTLRENETFVLFFDSLSRDNTGELALNFHSFENESNILVLRLESEHSSAITSLLKPKDSVLLFCLLSHNLSFPISGSRLLFKKTIYLSDQSFQRSEHLLVGISIGFNPFPFFTEICTWLSDTIYDPFSTRFFLRRNERQALGWRAQPAFLLDAIANETHYKGIFSNLDYSFSLPKNGAFNLQLFKANFCFEYHTDQKNYPIVNEYLHPRQVLAVSNWLNDISETTSANKIYISEKFSSVVQETYPILSKKLHLTLGMPGCGKTRSLVVFIHQFLTIFPTERKLLISTYTHAAIDSILEKIAELFPEDLSLVYKFTSLHGFNKDTESYYANTSVYTKGMATWREFRVVITTVLGLSSFPLSKFKFEAVVIDEASQILLPLSLLPLRFSSLAILIGDHCQLRPLFPCSSGNIKLTDSLPSFFEAILQLPRNTQFAQLSTLNYQFRMNSKLLSICNSLFYSNLMVNDNRHHVSKLLNWTLSSNFSYPSWPDAQLVFSPNTLDRACIFIDVRRPSSYDFGAILTSLVSVYNIGVFTPESEFASKHCVMVLAPFHSLLEELKRTFKLSCQNVYVSFSTIDSMQGKEADLVILYLPNETKSLMNDPRRLNVALSRASKKLIIIGSFDENFFFPPLFEIAKAQCIPIIPYSPIH